MHISAESRKAPQVYGFRLVGFDEPDLQDVTVKVHHNCDSDLLEICSHNDECVDEGASCAIPSMKSHNSLNIGKRIQGLARCLCDDEHKMEYLGTLIEVFKLPFNNLKCNNPFSQVSP